MSCGGKVVLKFSIMHAFEDVKFEEVRNFYNLNFHFHIYLKIRKKVIKEGILDLIFLDKSV